MAAEITPFWQRMPKFFQYPFRKPALWVLLGVTGGGLILSQIPILGPLALLALFLAVMKYAYEVLAETAEGYMEPPGITSDRSGTGLLLPLKQWFVYLAIGFVTYLVGASIGPAAALLVFIAALILLPASVIALATTTSLRAALNPVLLIQMVRRIGWAYAALYGMLLLLYAGSGTVVDLFSSILPGIALWMLALFSSFYFTFVMFHLMGYVLYQYHEPLDFLPEAVIEAGGPTSVDDELTLFEQFLAEEKYSAATAELLQVIHEHPDNLELKQRLHRLAQLSDDRQLMLRNGRELIAAYLDHDRVRDAVNLYLDCSRADPGFRPERPEDYAPLAQALLERGNGKSAVQLANGFHKRFPEHPATPGLYVLAAQVFCDELSREDQARAILDYVIKHFPQSPDTRRAKALRSAISA